MPKTLRNNNLKCKVLYIKNEIIDYQLIRYEFDMNLI